MKLKQTANKLESDSLLEGILQYSSDIIVVLTKNLTVALLNTKAEHFYGYSLQEVQGKDFLSLCLNSGSLPFTKEFFKSLSVRNINQSTKNRLGEPYNLNWNIYPLENGEILLLGKTFSQRNSIAYHLDQIIDAIPGCLYWKNLDGHYLGCNQLTAKLAGLTSPFEVIGKTDWELWKEQAVRMIEHDKDVIRQEKSLLVEEELITADGEWMYFTGVKMPLRNENNNIIGIIGNSLDITELKKIQLDLAKAKEKAEIANYIMTEFIANMGHDLATPITDVGSIAQVLSCYSDEYPELKELFDTLVMRSTACEEVRKSIINATSISALEAKSETFSIIEELLSIEKELRPTIGSKNLKFVIHPLKPKKEDVIETDRSKFHDILFDLIANAINFTEQGEIAISVTKKGNIFQIKVSDTGIGIPSDKFDYIFEQYTKLSRSNKYGTTFKGVGAGLYLAKIRAHIINATISVQSKLDEGSTFTVSIPAFITKSID